MWNYIVLGQVPGTDYYLNFTSVIVMYGVIMLLLMMVIVGNRQLRQGPEEALEFDDLQLSLLDFAPQPEFSRLNRLIAVYVCLAVVIVMKLAQLQRGRLRQQLSLYIGQN